MPASTVIELTAEVILTYLEHVLLAPGYAVRRWVLRQPRSDIKYDSAASGWVGLGFWIVIAVATIALWR